MDRQTSTKGSCRRTSRRDTPNPMNWQPSLFDDITDPLTDTDTPLAGYTDQELGELVAAWGSS